MRQKKLRLRLVNNGIACEQALLFGRVKRVSRERVSERRRAPSLARSRKAHFAYPNRRACSQANNGTLCRTAQIRKLYSISCSYTDLKAYCIECCIERICTYRSLIGLFSRSPTCIFHLHIFHNTPSPCLPSQILHKHCLQFLLGRLIRRGN